MDFTTSADAPMSVDSPMVYEDGRVQYHLFFVRKSNVTGEELGPHFRLVASSYKELQDRLQEINNDVSRSFFQPHRIVVLGIHRRRVH